MITQAQHDAAKALLDSASDVEIVTLLRAECDQRAREAYVKAREDTHAELSPYGKVVNHYSTRANFWRRARSANT